MMQLSIEDEPCLEDCDFVRGRLQEHNAAIVGPDNYAPLAIFARDGSGSIRGGLLGETFWQWLHISTVWIAASDRGQGLGTRLLALAEEEAVKRGCIGAFVDSQSFQAPDFYLNRGYEVWGELRDLPVGHRRIFLQKKLAPGGDRRQVGQRAEG